MLALKYEFIFSGAIMNSQKSGEKILLTLYVPGVCGFSHTPTESYSIFFWAGKSFLYLQDFSRSTFLHIPKELVFCFIIEIFEKSSLKDFDCLTFGSLAAP